MRVIYDGRMMAYQYTGLGRFTGELLFALLDKCVEDGIKYTVIILADASEAENFYYRKLRQYEEENMCQIVSVPCLPISLQQHFSLARFINRLDGDIYFYPHFDLPFGVRFPSVVVIHDLFPLKVPGYITKNSSLKTFYFRLMLQVVVRKAKFIFALSKTTRMDILAEVGQRFSGKLGVSLAGPIVRYLPTRQNLSPSFTVPDQFLLYVGDRRPHKNLKRIIDLFILLKEKTSYEGNLLLVGSAKNHDFDVEGYIGTRPDIQIAGQVNDQLLVLLYQSMDALICLSQYEGFGLPVVEAGLFRKKMIISNGGSLPDVAPPWAFVLPNETDMSRFVFQIREYLDGTVILDESYGKKYTWPSVAQSVSNKFVNLMGSCHG